MIYFSVILAKNFDTVIFHTLHHPCAILWSSPSPPLIITPAKWGDVCNFMAVIFDQILNGLLRTGPGWIRDKTGLFPLPLRARVNSGILDKPVTLISKPRIFQLVMCDRGSMCVSGLWEDKGTANIRAKYLCTHSLWPRKGAMLWYCFLLCQSFVFCFFLKKHGRNLLPKCRKENKKSICFVDLCTVKTAWWPRAHLSYFR